MKYYGAFEAKTHFSELLADAIAGKKCIITKHGLKVAMLSPISNVEEETNPVDDAIRAIKNMRKKVTLGSKMSIRQMREEGRK